MSAAMIHVTGLGRAGSLKRRLRACSVFPAEGESDRKEARPHTIAGLL